MGINVPLAIGDWLSLPFRLRDETTQGEVNEDKIVSKTERMLTDCSEFEILIYRQKFALPPDCRLSLKNEEFVALATKHPYLPRFEGAFYYALTRRSDGVVVAKSRIMIRKMAAPPVKIDFLEKL